MTKALFITATSTDVGKTYISSLITKSLIDNKVNAGYYKPVLSGANIENNKVISCDGLEVLKYSSLNEDLDKCVSYIMKTPVSPHLASKIEGIDINLDKIKSDFNNLKEKYDYITVEGAGGIICPVNLERNIMLTDVIKALNLDIVIVTNPYVGAINSTVLTVEYAKSIGINIKGIILNCFDYKNIAHIDNKNVIESITNIPIIDVVEKNKGLNIDTNTICSLYREV